MTEQEKMIAEAMARVDGFEFRGACWFCGDIMVSRGIGLLPEYTTSHDAVQRVIDELSEEDFGDYWTDLVEIIYGFISLGQIEWDGCQNILKATPLQKCEAILRAKGLWAEEMGVEGE